MHSFIEFHSDTTTIYIKNFTTQVQSFLLLLLQVHTQLPTLNWTFKVPMMGREVLIGLCFRRKKKYSLFPPKDLLVGLHDGSNSVSSSKDDLSEKVDRELFNCISVNRVQLQAISRPQCPIRNGLLRVCENIQSELSMKCNTFEAAC